MAFWSERWEPVGSCELKTDSSALHTFLNKGQGCAERCWSIRSWHVKMLDNREDVKDVVWTNGSFVLVVQEVVPQSQLVWAQNKQTVVLLHFFSGFYLTANFKIQLNTKTQKVKVFQAEL